MDSSELYDDLEEAGKILETNSLLKEINDLKLIVETLTTENESYKNQLTLITLEKNQLEQNMVRLYNTALREISRKDREIISLQTEIDNMKQSRK